MSSQTSIIYGAGFPVDVSDENLQKFILNHADVLSDMDNACEIVEDAKEMSVDEFNPKERYFDYENNQNGVEGIYGLITDVIFKETGVRMDYCLQDDNDCNGEHILLPECFPWQLNEAEKNLTADSFKQLCLKYMTELGIPETAYDDFVTMEYNT